MPYKVPVPEMKEFVLERIDAQEGTPPERATKVTIRQATMRQNSERSKLFSEFIRSFKDGEERVIFKLPLYDLIAKQIYLTLVACNIEQDEGVPLFKFAQSRRGAYLNMSYEDFVYALGDLQDDVVQEIHEKVLEVNPHWVIGSSLEEADLGEDL